MISIQSLCKKYNQHTVLKDINLEVKKGEIIGVVGENGAGKTTLFKCISGLEPCDGTVQYQGGEKLKNILGYLPTDLYFFSRMTGYEYLKLLCNARNVNCRNIDAGNIFELPLSHFAENYSSGMQRKLALTGLLLQKNEVYIFDEPFNGVDIQSNLIIQEILLKLKELGKTIIMSSHVFSTLEDSCDSLHYLKDGSIKTSARKGDFQRIKDEMAGQEIAAKISHLLNLE
jgi:ABC-2 type transport system ATP-binding protein